MLNDVGAKCPFMPFFRILAFPSLRRTVISLPCTGFPTSQESTLTKFYYLVCKMFHKTTRLFYLKNRILQEVKDGLQRYCETSYSRSGVNDMWFLKNAKELLESFRSNVLSTCNSMKRLTSLPFIPLYPIHS